MLTEQQVKRGRPRTRAGRFADLEKLIERTEQLVKQLERCQEDAPQLAGLQQSLEQLTKKARERILVIARN